MNRSHHNRAPGAGIVQRGSKLIWLVSLAVFGFAVVAAVLVFLPHPAADEIELAIKEAGFGPVTPPNRLRGPGSLYVAEGNNFYHQVCRADPAVLEGKVQTSPTVAHAREKLEKSDFTWNGDLVQLLNAKLDGVRVTSIKYSLVDVTIHEIADADLKTIQRTVMSDPQCENAVQDYLKEHKKVCSGYAALSASTSFRVYTESKAGMDVQEATKLTGVVKQHLEQHTGGQIQIRNTEEFSGENLYYGILLSEFCTLIDEDRVPRRVAEPREARISVSRSE
jgi:hypothetical protein